jgi:hypothetical protein
VSVVGTPGGGDDDDEDEGEDEDGGVTALLTGGPRVG